MHVKVQNHAIHHVRIVSLLLQASISAYYRILFTASLPPSVEIKSQ